MGRKGYREEKRERKTAVFQLLSTPKSVKSHTEIHSSRIEAVKLGWYQERQTQLIFVPIFL